MKPDVSIKSLILLDLLYWLVISMNLHYNKTNIPLKSHVVFRSSQSPRKLPQRTHPSPNRNLKNWALRPGAIRYIGPEKLDPSPDILEPTGGFLSGKRKLTWAGFIGKHARFVQVGAMRFSKQKYQYKSCLWPSGRGERDSQPKGQIQCEQNL